MQTTRHSLTCTHSDVLHPNRANVSKDELRQKLSELYKASKDNVSVFGFRTQFGGGKSTGFALIYDSPEAMKKFEPRYRLVRYGQATKIEKASRQQRMYTDGNMTTRASADKYHRQATKEQIEGVPWYSKERYRQEGQEGQIEAANYSFAFVIICICLDSI